MAFVAGNDAENIKMNALEKLAKILRADKDNLKKMETRLAFVTGKSGILERVVEENELAAQKRLARLGLGENPRAIDVHEALVKKVQSDDDKIVKSFKNPNCAKRTDCDEVLRVLKKMSGSRKGFFLKEAKAVQFLEKEPPKQVMGYLGYETVSQMLAKENLLEVYSALRFVEGGEWLNNVFFKQYEALTPADFEEREMEIKVLDEKWVGAADVFLKKKWHNISHLKELGVVFVIPATFGIQGELLRMISLVFHYLHEVPFYSDMFRRIAETPVTFASNLVSLLRGDVEERRLPENNKSLWYVVQRYLAKDDENDWRLFVPHINPEAMHWQKAEDDLVRLGIEHDGYAADLEFWKNLDWVGDYFKDEGNNDVLVSFDLVDTVMGLVKKKEMIKYLYHHEEALWNKIFTEYMGGDQLEKFSKEYLLEGYFEI